MTQDWFKRLEKALEEKIFFLIAQPYSENELLKEEEEEEDAKKSIEAITKKKRALQNDAKKLRKKILDLSQDIKAWRERSEKARLAGAEELAKKALKQEMLLMKQGRLLWKELDELGNKFKKINLQIDQACETKAKGKSDFEESWTKLEINQELDQLREKTNRKNDPKGKKPL